MRILTSVLVASAACLATDVVTSVSAANFCDLIRCSKEMAPVCGSNNVSYDNACMFQIAKCHNDALTIKNSGKCSSATTSAPTTPTPATPTPTTLATPAPTTSLPTTATPTTPSPTTPKPSATPVAVCEMMCLDVYDPVCGSDKVTYQNKCQLQLANCNAKLTESAVTITVASEGECASSDDAPITIGPIPEPPTNGSEATIGPVPEPTADSEGDATIGPAPEPNLTEPAVLCEMLCPSEFQPVCGSDGVTYPNACELRRASCRTRATISQVSDGECPGADATLEPTAVPAATGTSAPAKCPTMCPANYAPVCASNGKTYANKCRFQIEKCEQGAISTMAILSEGECTTEAEADGATPAPSASCLKVCTREFKPVCGSDGVTYTNRCSFENALCTKRISTSVMSATDGECA